MNSKRVYFGLVGAICLLFLGLIVGTVQVNKTLSSRADKLTNLKAKSAALAQERLTLRKVSKDIKTYTELQKITKAIVPEDKSQAEAVREIVKIAAKNDVSLASITFPASTLGNGPTPTAGATVAPVAAQASTAASSKVGSLSQLTPVKSIPGVYQLLITVRSDPDKPVRYDKFVNFLSDLERNRRTAQVSTITIEPDKENRNFLSFTLGLNEYIKP